MTQSFGRSTRARASARCASPPTPAARTTLRGEWVDKPNYFDVTVWGAQGENVAKYCSKGRPVAIDGRLEWREWDDKETGQKRSAVQIVAESVQFLGGRDDANGGGNGGARYSQQSDVPADTGDFAPAGAPAGGGGYSNGGDSYSGGGGGGQQDDDIPF